MNYQYGEEISYDYELIKPEDAKRLQAFSCGNNKLDLYIHNELIKGGEVDIEEGLPFKVVDLDTSKIIGIVSLAASGIIYKVGSYTHVLPAIKIDIFAIDVKFQKMPYDAVSNLSEDPDDHYYFSDDVMGTFIRHCRDIASEKAMAHYIVLYADKKAKRFYVRNLFNDFVEFMQKEKNMEIEKNDPMYMRMD